MSVIQPDTAIRRIPPQNLEAEQAVLAVMLLKEEAVARAMSRLSSFDFYRQSHRLIFEAMENVFDSRGSVEVISVMEELKRTSTLEEAGGVSYLADLTGSIASLSRLDSYIEIILEKSRLRQIIESAMKACEDCYENIPSDKVVDEFGRSFFKIAIGSEVTVSPVADIVPQVMLDIEDRSKRGSGLLGVSTGFVDLDKYMAGLPPTDLIILAARPAMGKTALATSMAESVASSGVPVLIFSLEMGRKQLVERSLARDARINLSSLRHGNVTDEMWPKLSYSAGKIQSLPIIIDDAGGMTVTQIRARAQMWQSRHPLGLVVVDYLQLIQGNGRSRDQEVAGITRGLKCLAKELDVPVLALSQLNRSLESRSDKRPIMSDLRESGAIEQDADTILFIYRDEVYNKNDDNPAKGIAEIIIGKQRNGPTGSVDLSYDGPYTRFGNLLK